MFDILLDFFTRYLQIFPSNDNTVKFSPKKQKNDPPSPNTLYIPAQVIAQYHE
jgi:hypothetical protein